MARTGLPRARPVAHASRRLAALLLGSLALLLVPHDRAWAQESPDTAAPDTAVPEATESPPSTILSERDPSWRAEVTLTCADADSLARTVADFTATVGAGETPVLYLSIYDPRSGGFLLDVIGVSSTVPAAVTSPNPDVGLSWQVQGILLGPWPVDAVRDTCASATTLPPNGLDGLDGVVIGAVLVVAGGVLLGAARRWSAR
jgi:hypothetical protein